MTIGNNTTRFIKSGAPLALLLALALVLVPVGASADTGSSSQVGVCNTAGPSGQGGAYVVDPADPQGALRNSENLRLKTNGNLNAAAHSRALATCYVPSEEPTSGGGYGDSGSVGSTT